MIYLTHSIYGYVLSLEGGLQKGAPNQYLFLHCLSHADSAREERVTADFTYLASINMYHGQLKEIYDQGCSFFPDK